MHLNHGLTIVVVGDVMLDAYVVGNVSRISPEAPVPVVEVGRRYSTLGGAGNVALNLSGLRMSVTLYGVVGFDNNGSRIHDVLAQHSIRDKLHVDNTIPTTVKTRVVANNQQLLRFDEERKFDDHANPSCPLNGIGEDISGGSVGAVVLSDYDKGVLTDGLVREIVGMCRAQGVPVLVDPKRADWSAFRGATVLKPNLAELRLVSNGCDLSDLDSIGKRARQLRESHEADNVLVTMGSRGMLLVTGTNVQFIPTMAKEVFDVSGAGDTAVAVLAACMASGYTLSDAAKVANAAAGIVVSKLGTCPIDLDELREAI